MKSTMFLRLTLACFLGLFVTSCANYQQHLSPAAANWEQSFPPTSEITHSVILIGDAGELEGNDAVYSAVKQQLSEIGTEGSIIFLGDNIYPNGLTSRDDSVARMLGEEKILKQLRIVDDYDGNIVFLPGNHDWNKGKGDGLKSIKRQRHFIEDYLDKKHTFLPSHGCPGPEEVLIDEKLVILVIDSQWWLQDWDKEPAINNKCEISSREEFVGLYEDALKRHADKNIMVAFHHPLMTAGPHAGNFPLKSHIFPLTDLNEGLYIPLPILGSLMPFYRKNFGNIQDVNHPKYKDFIKSIFKVSEDYPNVVFASGHEHALQYFKKDGLHQIVSGSGAKKEPLGKVSSGEFLHGEKGFARVDYHIDGKVWLSFFEPEVTDEPVFRTEMYVHKEPLEGKNIKYSGLEKSKESVTGHIEGEYEKGSLYESLFGEHYRPLYGKEILAPTLDLSTERGGLTPLKKGGGFQTRSLRLENPEGKQYVLRAMQKDATKLLPDILRGTFATDVVAGEFSTAHPYAAFVIPPLADAADVLHTLPKLVYVPKQPALGKYNVDLGDELYLYEERPAHDRSDDPNFGNSKDVVGTFDLIEEMENKFNHRPDQKAVVRARLLDMIIGDWDRHDDQWRWASFKEDGKTTYKPVPRDRDQPFASYDGVLYKIITLFSPDLRKWQEFEGDMARAKWFNFNARYFDRFFINELELEDWLEQAAFVQTQLTDELIDESLALWPAEIYAFKGDVVAKTIKARRDNLIKFAKEHFEFLSKSVNVVGTNKEDQFEIEYLENGKIEVQVFDLDKKGKKKDKYYERVFDPKVTSEVILYALEGKDEIRFINSGNAEIKIRIVGGPDKDRIKSKEGLQLGKVYAYDRPKGMKWDDNIQLKDRRTKIADYNVYNREDFKYNSMIPIILPGFNPDDGFNLSLGFTGVRNGFKKEPYSSSHTAIATYYFKTASLGFQYTGDFMRVFGNWGISTDVVLTNPTFNQFFFGLGNETTLSAEEDDIDYNRVRRSLYGLDTKLFRNLSDETRFSIGPSIERYRVQETPDRFITSSESGDITSAFGINTFVGYSAKFEHHHVNNKVKPNRGIDFTLEVGRKHNVTASDKEFTFLTSSLALYHTFSMPGNPVLATRVGGGKNWGEFEFYQGHYLGGFKNLRGFRNQRFAGGSSFYHNSEIRFKLFEYNNRVIPTGLGLLFSYDYGRVWVKGEDSDTWHDSIGGGIWVSPINSIVLSGNLNHSDEEDRFTFKVGFFF